MNFKKFITFSLLIMISLFLAQSAFAVDIGFSPTAKNSDLLVKYIIDPLSDGDVSENSIAAVSQVFLYSLLVIGPILLVYTIATGVTNTALQGELLGKKASTTYTVARNVFGVSMILPVFGGFAVVQKIVIWLAIQGVYLGDVAWEKFVSEQPLNSQIVLNKSVELKIIENLKPIAMAHVCYKLLGNATPYNSSSASASSNPFQPTVVGGQYLGTKDKYTSTKTYKDAIKNGMLDEYTTTANDTSKLGSRQQKIKQKLNESTISIGYKYKGTGSYNTGVVKDNREDFCGQFSLLTNELGVSGFEVVDSGSNSSSKTTKTDSLNIGNINTLRSLSNIIDLDEMKNKVNKLHETLFKNLIGDSSKGLGVAQTIADKLLDDKATEEDVAYEIVKVAHEDYYVPLLKQAKAQARSMNNLSGVKEGMIKDGIAGAGAWYWAIVSQGSGYSDLLNSPPNLIVNKIVEFNNVKQNEVLSYLYTGDVNANNLANAKTLQTKLQLAENKINRALYAITDSNIYVNAGLSLANSTYNFNQESEKFLQLFAGEKVSPLGGSDFLYRGDENPVITIHTLGYKALNWLKGALDEIISSTSGKSSNTAIIALPLFMALLVPGVTMVYYIPLLPFILWTGTLIGWIVMVLQGLFGAPLWMLAHLTPDKESFIGRQGQGYMLVLSLFIRPLLMVLGYVVSLQLLVPIGKLINAFFGFTALTVLGGTGFIWLIGVLSICVIYAMILQNTVKKIFSLIHVVPDSLLQWFGGNDSKVLGEYANGIEQGATQGLQSLGGAMQSVGTNAAFRMRGGAAGGGAGGSGAGAGGQGGSGGGLNDTIDFFQNVGARVQSGNPNSQMDAGSERFAKAILSNSGNNANQQGTVLNGTGASIATGGAMGTGSTSGIGGSGLGGSSSGSGSSSSSSSVNTNPGGYTLTQQTQMQAQTRGMRTDNAQWENLSQAVKDNIRNSNATCFVGSDNIVHAVPPQGLSSQAQSTLSHEQLNAMTEASRNKVQNLTQDQQASAAMGRSSAIRNGVMYDVARGKAINSNSVNIVPTTNGASAVYKVTGTH